MDWIAKWIWDHGEAAPRNYWLCFRKSFEFSESINEALLYITADSRYTVFINGQHLGMGPVRGWPSEQFYDTYDIKDQLKNGKNAIAVLVSHYGVSNFQYIEGRGGLFAQLELSNETGTTIYGSDDSWRTQIHNGFKRKSVRICCQQAWAEIYDANAMDDSWYSIEYNDAAWTQAKVIGVYGEKPWVQLKERDIPLLREEPVYPHRVEAIREVKPSGHSVTLDLQPNFFPDETDSNPKVMFGYLASIIHSQEDMKAVIRFPWDKHLSTYGNFKINSNVYYVDGTTKEVSINLIKGDNFFLMDLGGESHLPAVLFNIEAGKSVKFTVPGNPDSQFVTIGAFEHHSVINIGMPVRNKPDMNNEFYKTIWNSSGWEDIMKFGSWIKPVSRDHMCFDNVYMSSVYSKVLCTRDVPCELQNMVIPNQEYSLIYPGENADTEIILDFGKEVSGFLEFDLDAPLGTIIDFYGVEYVGPGMEIEHSEGMNCTLRYLAREGRQTYRSFIRRGFRYLFVTFRNISLPVKCYRVFINQSTYPVANVGSFECSDWKLNRIWEISKYTTQLCMEDTYVDCPAYEQTFWVGDARNESLVNYYTFGAYDICKRSLKLVAGSMDRSPLPESQVPSGWQNVLGAWAFFWMNACREYFEYTNDLEFIKEIYPKLAFALRGFIDRIDQKTGLLCSQTWALLEWAPMDIPDDGIITHQNAELVKSMKDVAFIATSLGRMDEAVKYHSLAEKIKVAMNVHLWDIKKEAYIDCIHSDGEKSSSISMQTNVMVYLCDCVEGDRKVRLEEYLLTPPSEFVQIKNPFMLFFYLEALDRLDKGDEIIKRISSVWGKMLNGGATTCWETVERFDMDRPTRSHCHAWSAAPGYFLGAVILGIRPLAPGFKKVLITPNLCGLEWARGSVPVPGGRISIQCENKNGELKVRVSGPKWIEYLGDTH